MNFLITRKLGDIIKDNKPFEFIDDSGLITGAEIMLSLPELMEGLDISQIKRKCEGLKLTVHLPFYDLNLASVDKHIRDYSMSMMMKGLDFCEQMDIKTAVSHFGYNVKLAGKASTKWKEKFFYQKRCLESEAEEKGVRIVWENTYEENFELFDDMLDADPETFFCLDSGHCNCFADFSEIEFLKRYENNIVHLHLHDNNGDEDSHLSPGSGTIDFKSLFEVVKGSNIENAVFEIEPKIYQNNKNVINGYKMREK